MVVNIFGQFTRVVTLKNFSFFQKKCLTICVEYNACSCYPRANLIDGRIDMSAKIQCFSSSRNNTYHEISTVEFPVV